MMIPRFVIMTTLLFNLVIVPSFAQRQPGEQQQPTKPQEPPAGQPQQPEAGQSLQPAAGQPQKPAVGQPQQPEARQPLQPAVGQPQQPAVGQPQQPAAGQQQQHVGPQPVIGQQQPAVGQPQPIAGQNPALGSMSGLEQTVSQQLVDTLQEGFYNQNCPNAEKIVEQEMAQIFKANPNGIAAILRLLFHDCFVGGCDASILLDSMESEEKVEKSSNMNGELLKGVDYIDDIKEKLEMQCPQTVSCADILAFAAEESMVLAGLPRRPKLGGRRDGTNSLAINVNNNIPTPTWTVEQLVQLFKRKGFNEEEMVILAGGHSLGVAHCNVFADRIYNYSDSGKPDPDLSQTAVGELSKICARPGSEEARANPTVNFDETPTKLDNLFYKDLVVKRKALLATDQDLILDPRTAPIVHKLAADPALFPKSFAELMTRMSALDVLTGNKGQIRRTCRATN